MFVERYWLDVGFRVLVDGIVDGLGFMIFDVFDYGLVFGV